MKKCYFLLHLKNLFLTRSYYFNIITMDYIFILIGVFVA